MCAFLAVSTASLTSSRGGSIIPVRPRKIRSFSISSFLKVLVFWNSAISAGVSSRKAMPRTRRARDAISSFFFRNLSFSCWVKSAVSVFFMHRLDVSIMLSGAPLV